MHAVQGWNAVPAQAAIDRPFSACRRRRTSRENKDRARLCEQDVNGTVCQSLAESCFPVRHILLNLVHSSGIHWGQHEL